MRLATGLQNTGGTVGTAVINDNDGIIKLAIQLPADFVEQRRNAFHFIIYRDDDR